MIHFAVGEFGDGWFAEVIDIADFDGDTEINNYEFTWTLEHTLKTQADMHLLFEYMFALADSNGNGMVNETGKLKYSIYSITTLGFYIKKPFFSTDPIWLLLADPSMIRPPNCFWLDLLKLDPYQYNLTPTSSESKKLIFHWLNWS